MLHFMLPHPPGRRVGRSLLPALVLALLTAMVFPGAHPAYAAGHLASPAQPAVPLTGEAALEQLKARGEYASLIEAYTQARYALHPQTDGQRIVAANPPMISPPPSVRRVSA